MRVARAIACSECVYLLSIKFDSQSTDLHSFSLSVMINSFTCPHPMRAFFARRYCLVVTTRLFTLTSVPKSATGSGRSTEVDKEMRNPRLLLI
jgi:hypothetical protein